jgi:hypothetical protein
MRYLRFFSILPIAGVLISTLFTHSANAHGVIGKRFMPTLFAVEDPFVADELSFLAGFLEEPAKGGEPALDETEIEGEFSKRITPKLNLSIGVPYKHLDPQGGPSESGFGNLELGAKYQFLTLPKAEVVASIAFSAEIGKTGREKAESDRFSTLSPSLLYGIGGGALPESLRLFRPLALTGVVGASFSTASRSAGEANPITLSWGFAVQYSLAYLDAFVAKTGLPAVLNRIVPVVEINLETCIDRPADCQGGTSGTVNPGLIWVGSKFQLAAAARIPINQKTGDDVGVFALVHFFIDDMFPDSLGRPIWNAR